MYTNIIIYVHILSCQSEAQTNPTRERRHTTPPRFSDPFTISRVYYIIIIFIVLEGVLETLFPFTYQCDIILSV